MARMDQLRHRVETVMRKESERQALYYYKRVKEPPVLNIGNRVYYPNHKLSKKADRYCATLAHQFLGPAFVEKIISPVVVQLRDEAGKNLGTHYTADLKIPRRKRAPAPKAKPEAKEAYKARSNMQTRR